jgi:hypothetical protein
MASGTITATGPTAGIAVKRASVKMDFAGTASVDIEEQMPSGAWIKIATGITADDRQVFESPTISTIRLNCTAYTNDVVWSIE